MLAGSELATGKPWFWGDGTLGPIDILKGIPFSFAFLSFLTVHEFGHYFMAVYHRVKCSLPYYIPMFIPLPMSNIGSFGAVIRIREVPPSRRKYFDIGIAGPLAGFVVALGMVLYGFMALPPMEQTVLEVHPGYIAEYGGIPSLEQVSGKETTLVFGGSLLFEGLKMIFESDPNFPPAFEMMHYPFIFAGFLGLFFTALNLLPIGQLDGGHVVYGLLGARRAGHIARVAVLGLLLAGGIGIIAGDTFSVPASEPFWQFMSLVVATRLLYIGFLFEIVRRLFPLRKLGLHLCLVGAIVAAQLLISLLYAGGEIRLLWLLYAFMAVRFIGVDHPIALDDQALTIRQKLLGILALLIFVLCFSFAPISLG